MKKIQIGDYFALFSKKRGIKSIRMHFNRSGELILTAPWYCSESRATAFALENREWIEKQVAKITAPRVFADGERISILGQEYTILHNPQHKGGVCLKGEELLVGGEEVFLHRRIVTFAKERLYTYMQQKTIEFAAQLGEKPRKITLRDTTSRWGSCSSNKGINYCWKLVFAPLYVIDYIVAHEVSHLKEMNHGPAFWETVAQFNVRQADAQIWLRKYGRDIQSIQSVS